MNKIIALVLILTGFGTAGLAAPQPDRIVEYKKTRNGALNLHIFNPPNHQTTHNTPVIVFFFGGPI